MLLIVKWCCCDRSRRHYSVLFVPSSDGAGFLSLLHVLLIQLCLLLIFRWHTWIFTWRHKQKRSDTMWPSYTTEPSLHISGTDTALLRRETMVCIWVWKRGVCSQPGGALLSILQPGGEDPVHKGGKLPSRKLEAPLTHLFPAGSTVKGWRRQQCFSASLGWPLDISDTSRCVRCFKVIWVDSSVDFQC